VIDKKFVCNGSGELHQMNSAVNMVVGAGLVFGLFFSMELLFDHARFNLDKEVAFAADSNEKIQMSPTVERRLPKQRVLSQIIPP